MAVWTSAARQAANFGRSPSPRSAATSAQSSILIQRRHLAAGGGEDDGPPKVNFWEDPMHPSKWKEEHYAIITVTGCGLLFYGGYKFLTGYNEDKNHEKPEGA